MKIDVYATHQDGLLVFLPEGTDPQMVDLPEDVTVSLGDRLSEGAELDVRTPGRFAADASYAVLDIVATGFHLCRVLAGSSAGQGAVHVAG